jgi:hypothetical protein
MFLAFSLVLGRTTGRAGAEASPSVADVLDQYGANQKALEHCEQVTDVRAELYLRGNLLVQIRQRAEYRRDGGRAFLAYSDLRADPIRPMPDPLPPLPGPAAKDPRFDSVSYSLSTADGSVTYTHNPQSGSNGGVILDVVDDEAERLQLLPNDLVGCWTRGWLFNDRQRLDEILRGAPDGARARTEEVAGRPCVRLDADAPGGHYAVWFDTGRGAAIVRVRVERGPHAVTRFGEVWEANRSGRELPSKVPYGPEDEKARETTAIEEVALERIGTAWLPVAATLRGERAGRDGTRRGTTSHFAVRWQLSPKFGPDAFRLDIPNGVKVSLRAGNDFADAPLEWRDGRAVPAADAR